MMPNHQYCHGHIPHSTWATRIWYALHEDPLLKIFVIRLPYFWHSIDDIFSIWLVHPDLGENAKLWHQFKTMRNDFHCMECITSECSKKVGFMDLTIKILGNKIETTLFKNVEPLPLYPSSLYAPPRCSSCIGYLWSHPNVTPFLL